MADELEPLARTIPPRLKRSVLVAGALLTLVGLPPALNLFCIVPFSLLGSASDAPVYVMASLILVLVSLAAGGVMFYHANQSLHGKTSKPMRLPSSIVLVYVFGVLLILGILVSAGEFLPGIFIPPVLFLAAALPPLWAIAWFIGHNEGSHTRLTWRRGMAAFAGGASAGLFIALVLEILLPAMVMALGFDLFSTVTENLESFFYLLGRERWAAALSSQGFVYVFLHLTLIAPLVEELAKPLVILPVLRYLDRQETFWIGAIAGAGFAVLGNSLYATLGIEIWLEILFVCALGSAIQPFGSGLVALGWQNVLKGEPGAWSFWGRRFGVAVVIHAAWNAGLLLVAAIGATLLSGNLPPEAGLPMIAAAGILFISLTLLGISTLWLGRRLGQGEFSLPYSGAAGAGPDATHRRIAIWALACLLFVLPAGLILSRLWLR